MKVRRELPRWLALLQARTPESVLRMFLVHHVLPKLRTRLERRVAIIPSFNILSRRLPTCIADAVTSGHVFIAHDVAFEIFWNVKIPHDMGVRTLHMIWISQDFEKLVRFYDQLCEEPCNDGLRITIAPPYALLEPHPINLFCLYATRDTVYAQSAELASEMRRMHAEKAPVMEVETLTPQAIAAQTVLSRANVAKIVIAKQQASLDTSRVFVDMHPSMVTRSESLRIAFTQSKHNPMFAQKRQEDDSESDDEADISSDDDTDETPMHAPVVTPRVPPLPAAPKFVHSLGPFTLDHPNIGFTRKGISVSGHGTGSR